DHHGKRRQEKRHLPVDEVERRQVDAHGDRWACGQRQHRAKHHQTNKTQQRPLVDGPPPLGGKAAIGACETDHAAAPPVSASTRCTSRRNMSPRSSKFLNWSNEAQAGESSTTRISASP